MHRVTRVLPAGQGTVWVTSCPFGAPSMSRDRQRSRDGVGDGGGRTLLVVALPLVGSFWVVFHPFFLACDLWNIKLVETTITKWPRARDSWIHTSHPLIPTLTRRLFPRPSPYNFVPCPIRGPPLCRSMVMGSIGAIGSNRYAFMEKKILSRIDRLWGMGAT